MGERSAPIKKKYPLEGGKLVSLNEAIRDSKERKKKIKKGKKNRITFGGKVVTQMEEKNVVWEYLLAARL